MATRLHATRAQLDAGLAHVNSSPRDAGVLQLIVRRPQEDEREILGEAMLDAASGLVGDSWMLRGSSRTADGSPDSEAQLTLMNSRVASLLASSPEEWALAGDHLFVDLDLGAQNLPPGTLLSVGSAVIAITARPHTGCKKFSARFGPEALQFINAVEHRTLRMRGIYAKVATSGVIHAGDAIRKVHSV